MIDNFVNLPTNPADIAKKYGLCTSKESLDDVAHWMVQLSNGLRIHQKDSYGDNNESSWLILKKYLTDQSLDITDMWVVFRSHVERVGKKNSPGFYFAKGIIRDTSWTSSKHGLVTGYMNSQFNRPKLIKYWWSTPELAVMRREELDISEVNNTCLWINNNGSTENI